MVVGKYLPTEGCDTPTLRRFYTAELEESEAVTMSWLISVLAIAAL
jgi:hypothetical protein